MIHRHHVHCFTAIVPAESSDESDVSSDSSDSSEDVRVVEGWPLSSGPNQPLGDWEKYTKVRAADTQTLH